ncbi:MAG: alcohol dehydrogenase class IV [Cryomorphaceae bacterium]|jgi:alcohol dehydrogenase class IV
MPTDFQFITVPQINFALGAAANLATVCASHGVTRPYIVTDPGILQFNLLDSALAEFKVAPVIYSDVVADPPEHVVIEATAAAKDAGCDGVVGFGGGSSMDVAKLVAVLLSGEQDLPSMYGVDCVNCTRVPLIQVPTTAGTGSEATNVAIVTTGESTKAGVVSRQLYADHIILDAELTLGLPAHVTAATGIDAMVHAIEAFTSKRLKNPMSDMLALKALDLMSSSITTAVEQGSDLQARSNMLYGAMLAGQAFSNSPVGAVHALAYPLGGSYHIPHGLSNSLVLPHVLRFNAASAVELYEQICQVVLPQAARDSQGIELVNQLADYFLGLARDLGLQTTLAEMNIASADVPGLAEQAMLQQRLLINNPREVLYNDALAIYQAAY